MSRRLVILALLLTAGYSLTNKQKFANKFINCGVKIVDNATIRKICTCMETPVYQMQPMTDLITAGQSCALANAGNLYAPVMSLYTQMESCLKPANSDIISLVMRLYNTPTAIGKKMNVHGIFDILMGKIKMWRQKKPKLTKAQVIQNMYGFGIKQFNKSVINKFCKQLVKSGSISKAEWKCALQYGKSVVDFNGYECAKMTPP